MSTLLTQRVHGYTKASFLPQGGIFLFWYETSEYLHNLNNFRHLNISDFFFFCDSHLTSVQIPSDGVGPHHTNAPGSLCGCFSWTCSQSPHIHWIPPANNVLTTLTGNHKYSLKIPGQAKLRIYSTCSKCWAFSPNSYWKSTLLDISACRYFKI